ncbi:MAG: discoidin domain-containing protein [Burkholderiales bacterium]|nr:discoidin domain-containing protein [Anaerolineae bacterium]
MKSLLLLFILLITTFTGIAAAQDSTEAATRLVPVFAAEDVINESLQLTDISDTSVQLDATTSLPMACVFLYGETPEFGQMALDSLMGAAAHQEHAIILTGLEPDTEYYYRVQGSDEAGNLYMSETYTFRTLPEIETTATTSNLLSSDNGAALIGYSSVYGDGPVDGQYGAMNALDDDPLTQWSSAGDGDDAWLEVELEQRSRINEVVFWTRAMSNDTAQIYSFTITTETGEVYGPFELPNAEQSYTFDVEIVAERLRFDVESSNGGNTGALDIAVYGEPVE